MINLCHFHPNTSHYQDVTHFGRNFFRAGREPAYAPVPSVEDLPPNPPEKVELPEKAAERWIAAGEWLGPAASKEVLQSSLFEKNKKPWFPDHSWAYKYIVSSLSSRTSPRTRMQTRSKSYICPNDTLIGHSCGTLLTLVAHSCGTLL